MNFIQQLPYLVVCFPGLLASKTKGKSILFLKLVRCSEYLLANNPMTNGYAMRREVRDCILNNVLICRRGNRWIIAEEYLHTGNIVGIQWVALKLPATKSRLHATEKRNLHGRSLRMFNSTVVWCRCEE